VVEKRKAIGAGVQAGASVLASSEYGTDTLVHGKSHAEASSNLDKKMKDIVKK